MERLLVDAHKGLRSCELISSSATVWMSLKLTFRPLSFTKLGLCSRIAEYVAIVPANGRCQDRTKRKW